MRALLVALVLCLAPSAMPFAQGLGPRALAGPPRPLPRAWVVDAGGGGDFTSLQPAVDAAADGDLILVRSDLLDGGASVQGKGLAMVGDGGRRVVRSAFPPTSQPALTVTGLAADQQVVVRGLELQHVQRRIWPIVRLADNEGVVWIEDCLVSVATAFIGAPQAGIEAEACAALVLVRSSLVVEPPNAFDSGCLDYPNCESPPALGATDCQVHAFECTFRGTDGLRSGGLFLPAGNGAQGIRLEGSSFLFASGCSVRGGDGGDGAYQVACFKAGNGGAGLWIPTGTEAHLLETTLSVSLPGEIAFSPSGPCPGGTFGPPWAPAGPVAPFESAAGDVRSYALPSPLRAPGGTLVARGVPGDLLVSVIADAPESTYLPLQAGTQLVAPPFRFRVEGTVPAGGVLSVAVPVPPLPPSLGFAREFRQGLFLGAGADASLGSATAVVLVP